MRRSDSSQAEFWTLNFKRQNGPGVLEVTQSPCGANGAKEGEQYAKTVS